MEDAYYELHQEWCPTAYFKDGSCTCTPRRVRQTPRGIVEGDDLSKTIVSTHRLSDTPKDQTKTKIADMIADIAGSEAPITTNERGGQQSAAPARFDLVDSKAMFAMAKVLHEGAEKYAPGNWRLIPVRDHINHLIMHAYAYLDGDTSDDHLSHMLCRAMFATAVDADPEATPEKDERGS